MVRRIVGARPAALGTGGRWLQDLHRDLGARLQGRTPVPQLALRQPRGCQEAAGGLRGGVGASTPSGVLDSSPIRAQLRHMARSVSKAFAGLSDWLSKWMGSHWAFLIAALLVVSGLAVVRSERHQHRHQHRDPADGVRPAEHPEQGLRGPPPEARRDHHAPGGSERRRRRAFRSSRPKRSRNSKMTWTQRL